MNLKGYSNPLCTAFDIRWFFLIELDMYARMDKGVCHRNVENALKPADR